MFINQEPPTCDIFLPNTLNMTCTNKNGNLLYEFIFDNLDSIRICYMSPGLASTRMLVRDWQFVESR